MHVGGIYFKKLPPINPIPAAAPPLSSGLQGKIVALILLLSSGRRSPRSLLTRFSLDWANKFLAGTPQSWTPHKSNEILKNMKDPKLGGISLTSNMFEVILF